MSRLYKNGLSKRVEVVSREYIPNVIQNLAARRVQSAKNRLLQRGIVLI